MRNSLVKTTILAAAMLLSLSWVTPAQSEVVFDWATVGNPGNPFDPETGLGSVDYTYRISKHEVTNSQFVEFLNAVDPVGANLLALYNPSMASNALGGINFNASAANGSKYMIKPGRGNNPVVYVDYLDAMRFVNWLQNGQGNAETETGAYTVSDGMLATRNPGATYFLPTQNEWYKSAYHKNDGVTGNYWNYPTRSDSGPFSDQPPGTDAPNPANTANFEYDDGIANGYDDGYAVTGVGGIEDPRANYLTDVGAYTQSVSPYGTFDQGGNVWEFMPTPGYCCFTRGGSWGNDQGDLRATELVGGGRGSNREGFRIVADAFVPVPSHVQPVEFLFSFDIGQDRYIRDIAADDHGKIYMTTLTHVDSQPSVEVYHSDGAFDFEFGSLGNGNGQFGIYFSGIDVDQNGNIYVVDGGPGGPYGRNRVQVFDDAGAFLFTFGESGSGQITGGGQIAVDDDRGRLGVTSGGGTHMFDLAGNFQFAFSPIPNSTPTDLAFDDQGNIYVSQGNGGLIHYFDSSVNYQSNFQSFPARIEVDANGNIYAASDPVGTGVAVYDNEGTYQYSVGNDEMLAIDVTLGRIYTASGSTVHVWEYGGIPEPGDFNGDGLFDCIDVDDLVVQIVAGTNAPTYDLTGDGFVTRDDLTEWLAIAGAANLPSGNSYLPGDANLNGDVDGSDFGIWYANKFTNIAAWCSGDFSANGVVDGSDFGIWNANKFTSANTAAAVPEPVPIALMSAGLVLAMGCRRSRQSMRTTRAFATVP